jgi:phospholipid/cholesterol/gamma-HCH transport system substrate-binding protein
MSRLPVSPWLLTAVAALVAVVAGTLVMTGDDPRTVRAVFPSTVSLFEGSDVKIMGVRVGKVTSVVPRGTSVLVEMEYADEHDLPADVQAVIVSPSVIGDRFVQLTPAYDDGATLENGATIEAPDTAVPVELDDMVASTRDLASALGPEGANRDGALAALLKVSSGVLDGQGAVLRQSLTDLAGASGTLAGSAPALGDTLGHAAGLTRELAEYDDAVRTFDARLARVARSLAADRDGFSDLLSSLAVSLAEVEGFVRTNRRSFTRNVESLTGVARVLRLERRAIATVLDLAPLGFTNLVEAYDPDTASVRTRANFGEIIRAVDKALCAELEKQLGTGFRDDCGVVSDLFALLPLRDGAPDGAPEGAPPSGEGGPPAPPALPGPTDLGGLVPDALRSWVDR